MQKYERGANRIGSSRLHDLCAHPRRAGGYFFDELPPTASATRPAWRRTCRFVFDGPTAPEPQTMPRAPLRRETLELVRAFNRIDDAALRRRLFELAKALAAMLPRGPKPAGDA